MNQYKQVIDNLITEWKNDTAAISSSTQINNHKNVQKIIDLGYNAVPYLISKMDGHLSYILRQITGINPILPEHCGMIDEIATDWKNWGIKNGYLIELRFKTKDFIDNCIKRNQ